MRTMFVEKWLVGLTESDAALRRIVAVDGEPATETFRRGLAALRALQVFGAREPEARDHALRYRKPPLCRQWMQSASMTLTRATAYGDQLVSRRWEVELIQVQAAVDQPPEEELVLDKELYEGDDD